MIDGMLRGTKTPTFVDVMCIADKRESRALSAMPIGSISNRLFLGSTASGY
jgi:hypothetical protein